jgi:hypothetical protein
VGIVATIIAVPVLNWKPAGAQPTIKEVSFGDATVEMLMPSQTESVTERMQSPIGGVPTRFLAGKYSSRTSGAVGLMNFGAVLEEGYTLQNLSQTVREQFLDNIIQNIAADLPEENLNKERISLQGRDGREISLGEEGKGKLLVRVYFLDGAIGLYYLATKDPQGHELLQRVAQSFRIVE